MRQPATNGSSGIVNWISIKHATTEKDDAIRLAGRILGTLTGILLDGGLVQRFKFRERNPWIERKISTR